MAEFSSNPISACVKMDPALYERLIKVMSDASRWYFVSNDNFCLVSPNGKSQLVLSYLRPRPEERTANPDAGNKYCLSFISSVDHSGGQYKIVNKESRLQIILDPAESKDELYAACDKMYKELIDEERKILQNEFDAILDDFTATENAGQSTAETQEAVEPEICN